MLWCNVTASKKTSNTFQAFHFLVFFTARYCRMACTLVTRVSSYFWAGEGPEKEVRKSMATNFCSMQLIIWFFWSQKVFLMAGRSPLKCDNSHWRSIDWFGTIHTEWNARCLTCVHSTSEIVCNRGKQDYK